MKARLNYKKVAPGVYDAMDALDEYLSACGLETRLLYLIQLRASQINGCAYCLDMHWKDLRAIDETEQRLYSLDAWRECPYYTDRERAALAWTEALTLVAETRAPDDVYRALQAQFGEEEQLKLTFEASTTIPVISPPKPWWPGSFPSLGRRQGVPSCGRDSPAR
jgi:AhpD family alkylhydroperoxidase